MKRCVWLALLVLGCSEELQVVRGDATLVVDPSEADFGDVAVGVQSRLELELRNKGNVPIKLSAQLDDSLGQEFMLEGVPDSLGPEARTTATLSFAPTSPGARQGNLTFSVNTPQNPEVVVPVKGRGVPPALISDPAVLDFGRVVIGTTESATVTLTNSADFRIEVIRAQQEASGEFASALERTFLDPGQRVDLVVTYSPGDIGVDEGRITIIDNSPRAESLGIRLRGEGVESDIVVEPLQLTFSQVVVGGRQTQTFVIRNIGEDAHEITEVLFGSNRDVQAGEFELDPVSTPAQPFSLSPGQEQSIEVVYQPTDAGADADTVRVASPGLSVPASVELNATAESAPTPRLQVMPAALAFGPLEVSQSRALDVTISNVGTAVLTLTQDLAIDPASAPFSLQNAPANGTTYQPTDNSTFQVVFTPTAVGIESAELVITSDDPTATEVRVPIGGEGSNTQAPAIFVSPNPVDFGQVPRGTLASRSVLVRNDGSAPLDLNMVRLSNDAGSRFLLPAPPTPGTTLTPGQQLNFNVDYSDNGVVQTYNGTLEIQSNDPSSPTTVPLSAATAPPPAAMTDISITLTWSSTAADIDVHLVRPGGTFFDSPTDCCYCNTNPDWGVMGQTNDNPFLDRDDLTGPGPENINLGAAEDGEYEVVLHYFSTSGAGDVTATVEVRVRGTLIASRTETLAPATRWLAGRVNWSTAVQAGTWSDGFFPPFPTVFALCF